MRWVVGVLLVGTAILKAVEFVSEPAAALTSPLGRWFLPTQIGAECAIGLFVLNGFYWRQLRWIALLLFGAFGAYSLSLALGGAETCGCFGTLKVNPWWTLLLDFMVVLGLLISVWRNQLDFDSGGSWHVPHLMGRQTITVVILSFSVLSTAVLVRYANSRTAVAGDLRSSADELIVLEPERWIAQKFPIADFLDLDVSKGKWILLFHRHDCPDCQAAVPRYKELAKRVVEQHVALVEVPPFAGVEVAVTGPYKSARLRNDRGWFVKTPVEIELTNGVVTSASSELPALVSPAER